MCSDLIFPPCHLRLFGGLPCVQFAPVCRPQQGPSLTPHSQSPYPMYCSDLLNFLAKYLADALLGILTMDSSLP